MYYATKYNLKGVRLGLFCEDYPSLKERQISKIPFEFPPWLGTLNRSEHEFTLAPEWGGGIIAFRNLDDPSKYLSAEFAAILIDELTKNVRETFDFLIMRLRWPGIPDVKFIGATNPGSIGHGWVKKLWITRDFTDERIDPSDFHFISAKVDDNKFLDKEYEKQLDTLPDDLRRAYREGDWDIFAGQYFNEFRREYHVCEPFKIPKEWFRFGCGDYGYTNPSALYRIAYDKAFDTYYVYHELYGPGHTYPDLGKKIIEANRVEENHHPRDWVFDPAIWAKKDSPRSGAMDLEDAFKTYNIRLIKGDNHRINGWNRIRELLKTYDFPIHDENTREQIGTKKKSRLVIFSTCTDLIRTLPELVHDGNKVEDVDSDGEDHGPDSLRYGLQWHRQKYVQTKEESYDTGTSHLKASGVNLKSDFDEEFDNSDDGSLFSFT